MNEYKKCLKCGNTCTMGAKFCVRCGYCFSDVTQTVPIPKIEQTQQTQTINVPVENTQTNQFTRSNTYTNNFDNTNSYNTGTSAIPRTRIDETRSSRRENKSSLSLPVIILIIVAVISVLACLFVLVILPMIDGGSSSHSSNNNNYSGDVVVDDNNKEEDITVPNIIGCTQKEVENLLLQSGITNYEIISEETNSYQEGLSFYSSVNPGDKYNPNNKLVVKIAVAIEEKEYYVVEVRDTIKVRTSTHAYKDNSNYVGKVNSGQKFIVYETVSSEGYDWYRIGNNKWIANDGSWAYLYDDENLYDEVDSAVMMILIKDQVKSMPIYDSQSTSKKVRDAKHQEVHLVYQSLNDSNGTWYQIEDGYWLFDKNDKSITVLE